MNIMKTAIVTTLIALTFTQAQARAPHERGVQEEIMNSIQNGKINAAMLNSLDREIREANAAFEKELSELGDANSYVEGKIQASMITMIGDELLRIQDERSQLENKNEIVDADVEPLKERLEEVKKIIEELKIDLHL